MEEDARSNLTTRKLRTPVVIALAAVVGCGLLIGGVFIGVSASNNSGAEPPSSSGMNEEADTGDESGAPSATPAPDLIVRLNEADLDTFVAASRDEKLTWANYWADQYQSAYEFVYDPEYDPDLFRTSLTEESSSDTDKQIIDNLNHMYQLAFMTPENYSYTDENGEEYSAKFDAEDGKKMVSGFLSDNTPGSGVLADINKTQDRLGNGALAASNVSWYFRMADPNFTGSNFDCEDLVTQAMVVCRSMDIIENGASGSLRVILAPYEDGISGATRYQWLAVDR